MPSAGLEIRASIPLRKAHMGLGREVPAREERQRERKGEESAGFD